MLLTEKDYHLVTANVYYLEMHQQPDHWPAMPQGVSFTLLEKPINPDAYMHYYRTVGFTHNWLDRLAITNEALSEKINAANIAIYVLKMNNEDAGFVEFILDQNFTEILYFGLFPAFIGKGLGKFFLQWAIDKAWSFNVKWIQLNTCSLDHTNALTVYQSQGFKIVRTTEEERKILNKAE